MAALQRGAVNAGTRVRYGAVSQALHWATAVVVLIAFIYGPGGSEQRVYSPARDFDRQLHETLGLAVFVLVLVRVVWRQLAAQPQAAPGPRWMRTAAACTHGALYALMLALPLTAVTGAWLEGHPLTLVAGIRIPPMLALSHDLGKAIATVHTWLGDAIMWLAGLHALAGLYHHFVLGDAVLVSMLPRWFPAGRP